MPDRYSCPQCKEDSVVYPNGGEPYCEDCGWPQEDFNRPGVDVKEKRVWRQTLEAMGGHHVTCCCDKKLPIHFAFRCLYCGEYYCQKCAEVHFGKTREEHNNNKLKKG